MPYLSHKKESPLDLPGIVVKELARFPELQVRRFIVEQPGGRSYGCYKIHLNGAESPEYTTVDMSAISGVDGIRIVAERLGLASRDGYGRLVRSK